MMRLPVRDDDGLKSVVQFMTGWVDSRLPGFWVVFYVPASFRCLRPLFAPGFGPDEDFFEAHGPVHEHRRRNFPPL